MNVGRRRGLRKENRAQYEPDRLKLPLRTPVLVVSEAEDLLNLGWLADSCHPGLELAGWCHVPDFHCPGHKGWRLRASCSESWYLDYWEASSALLNSGSSHSDSWFQE